MAATRNGEANMPMNYEELDDRTREYMHSEFEKEQGGNSNRSKALLPQGWLAFLDLMREAIRSGNEISLANALAQVSFWEIEELYTREGITRSRKRNISQSATRLAITEFSTWYVRGLSRKLLDEGIDKCQVYRGEQPKWEPGECAEHEGRIILVQTIYDNHRAQY